MRFNLQFMVAFNNFLQYSPEKCSKSAKSNCALLKTPNEYFLSN